MIQSYAHQKQLHEARLDTKTLERLFANLITEGTNCSPFESDVIVEKAKEIFAVGSHAEGNILQPGQMVWTAIDLNEPPGKPLKECQLRRVILTHLAPKEDAEVKRAHGPGAKRRQQIVRMAVEAKEQHALLTQEDLAEILDTDVRTIRRDIQELREKDIMAPTRGQMKDIGPGVTHKVKAVTMFLQEKEPLEIARAIKHSLTAIERYIDTFCRVVYCQRLFRDNLKTALVVGVSVAAVNTYMALHTDACEDPAYRDRLAEIEKRGLVYYKSVDFKKNLGLTERRPK
jgi:DNA-binding transcriptional regulator YhcF (GntR family)